MRIVALAAEAVDILHHLNALETLVGVSRYAPLPPGVQIPVVGGFASVHLEKILNLQPDLVLLTSDVQIPISRDLVRQGLPVLHLFPKRLDDLFRHIRWIGGLVGRSSEAEALIRRLQTVLEQHHSVCPPLRVFWEEWPDPQVYASGWLMDLVEWLGGVDVFPELRTRYRASERVIHPEEVISRDPEVILFSWCGRPGKQETILKRPGWEKISAVRHRRVVELPSDFFLQVGPSLILQGVPLLVEALQESS